eukprot:3886747-Lingulodinium_polyedra.AAC.1
MSLLASRFRVIHLPELFGIAVDQARDNVAANSKTALLETRLNFLLVRKKRPVVAVVLRKLDIT